MIGLEEETSNAPAGEEQTGTSAGPFSEGVSYS